MTEPDTAEVLRDQRDYYAARAPEYDEGYRRTGGHDRGVEANASWLADLALLVTAFDQVAITGDVVELAAGTGFWTERIVRRAQSLTVIDGSAEMLALNRERLGESSDRVSYEVADLFEWQPSRSWDACVFCFWICHVPDDLVADFLRKVAASVRPEGAVVFIDKAAETNAMSERVDRTINDGRRFTIIDHPRPRKRLVQLCAEAGLAVEVRAIGSRHCLAHGIRR